MSTKTTFKRIALVAVAALGLGVLTSVAPASATTNSDLAASLTVGTIPTPQVGVVNTTPVTVSYTGTAGGSDTFTVNVRVTSAPAGSQYRSLTTNLVSGVTASGNTIAAKLAIARTTGNVGTLGTNTAWTDSVTVGSIFTSAASSSTSKSAAFDVSFTPDVAGAYTILVSVEGIASQAALTNLAGVGTPYSSGDASASYTVSTANTASSVTLAAVAPTGNGVAGTDKNLGMIFKATIKDAAGAAAQLGNNETIRVYASSKTGTVTMDAIRSAASGDSLTTQGNTAEYTLSNADFTSGVAYLKFTNSEAESAVITAVGTGLLASTVTGTLTLTTKSASTVAATPTYADSTAQAAAIALGAGGHTALTAGTTVTSTSSKTATSHSYKVTFGTNATTAGDYVKAAVVDTSGKISGLVGAKYGYAIATTASASTVTAGDRAAISISATLSTTGNSFTVQVQGGGILTVSSAASAVTTLSAVSPTATTIRQADGGSTVMNLRVLDQFGAAMVSEVVTVATTGRNASTSSTTLVSDASGYIAYTRTDAGTSASTNKSDVVTFTSSSVTTVTKAFTVNYGSTAVATVTCTSGTELDTATSVTYRDISSDDGAEDGAASLCTVTVKDANGAILVGVPVTTTTTSAGAAVVSTSATLYTGAAGTVAPRVYAWTTGAKVFTVTAGGVTSTETVNYHQETATEVRSISVVADGNRHLVTAKDRFGNVVPGVRIYGTRTGSGLFGGGAPTANAITSNATVDDANEGIAEFIFNAGSTDSVVKYQVASAADTPSATYGYTSAVKGSSDDGTTALTAYVAGTALKAEVGVGASFDAAGVNSVTATIAAATGTATDVAQTAADAAAEATDAANAATDAANAAAEAADAATAAAQDAADAVAALSAQVAALISGLKAQLTALTNLVIKIQKKVKA